MQQQTPREASVHLGVLEGPLRAVIRVCLCNEVYIAQVKNVGTFRFRGLGFGMYEIRLVEN